MATDILASYPEIRLVHRTGIMGVLKVEMTLQLENTVARELEQHQAMAVIARRITAGFGHLI